MDFRFVALIVLFASGPFVHAEQSGGPPYLVELTSGGGFELRPGTKKTITLSARPEIFASAPVVPKVIGLDYDAGVAIETDQPVLAAQEIMRQIGQRTGLRLRTATNSATDALKPLAILQGVSETAVVTIVLSPATGRTFNVGIAYVLYKRPAGSIDGTPDAIAAMDAEVGRFRRMMNEDSVATELPKTVLRADAETQEFYERFFRGAARLGGVRDGRAVQRLLLMLKRQDAYSVAFYDDIDGVWKRIGNPIQIRSPRPPVLTDLPGGDATAARFAKADAEGFEYVYVEGDGVKRVGR